jgi:hypothetical protein
MLVEITLPQIELLTAQQDPKHQQIALEAHPPAHLSIHQRNAAALKFPILRSI